MGKKTGQPATSQRAAGALEGGTGGFALGAGLGALGVGEEPTGDPEASAALKRAQKRDVKTRLRALESLQERLKHLDADQRGELLPAWVRAQI